MGINLSQVPLESSPAVLNSIKTSEAIKIFTHCSLAIGVWEWLVCLPAEYRLIWRKENSVIKWLYVFARFSGLATAVYMSASVASNWDYEKCKSLSHIMPALAIFPVISGEMILGLRAAGLWGRETTIVLFLMAWLLAELTVLIISTVMFEAVQLPPRVYGCFAHAAAGSAGKAWSILYFAFPCVTDAILFGLSTYKAIELWHLGGKNSRLIGTLIRDGSMWFAGVFFLNLVNIVLFVQTANPSLQEANVPLTSVASSMFCCRLVLNLRSNTAVVLEQNRRDGYTVREVPKRSCEERGVQKPIVFTIETTAVEDYSTLGKSSGGPQIKRESEDTAESTYVA